MATVIAVLTAAMIRIVVRGLPSFYGCEVCGASDAICHRVECGDVVCESCLVERRHAYRVQGRPARLAAARQAAQERVDGPRYDRWLRWNWEGDESSFELARDGYYDVAYDEYHGSEFSGPKPRWVTEVVALADEVTASTTMRERALFVLSSYRRRRRHLIHSLARNHTPDAEVAEELASLRRKVEREVAQALATTHYVADGHRDLAVMYDGTDDRDMGDDVMAWLHRDPSNRAVLNRWHRPDDELAFMDRLREEGRESEWWELMVDFRRRKLDALLKEYFGLDDYRASMIVLKWEKGSSGRWRPAKQMNAVDWVKWSCEQSGSILGGLQSCTRSIQTKTLLRKRKEAAAAVALLEPEVAERELAENQRVEVRNGKSFVVTVLPMSCERVERQPVALRQSAAPSIDEVADDAAWEEESTHAWA